MKARGGTVRSFGEQMSASDVLVDLGVGDVDDYFRRIRISESVGQYFTFPGVVSAKELRIAGSTFRGALLVVAESQVHICCSSVPMGFG